MIPRRQTLSNGLEMSRINGRLVVCKERSLVCYVTDNKLAKFSIELDWKKPHCISNTRILTRNSARALLIKTSKIFPDIDRKIISRV